MQGCKHNFCFFFFFLAVSPSHSGPLEMHGGQPRHVVLIIKVKYFFMCCCCPHRIHLSVPLLCWTTHRSSIQVAPQKFFLCILSLRPARVAWSRVLWMIHYIKPVPIPSSLLRMWNNRNKTPVQGTLNSTPTRYFTRMEEL